MKDKVILCRRENLPQGHTCLKKRYAALYLNPINEAACAAMTFDYHPEGTKLPGLVLEYHFGDKKVRAQVCYSDYPDCPLMEKGADLVIKLKYANRFRRRYEAHSLPVFPGGFIPGPQTHDAPAAGRQWFRRNLPDIRAIGDGIMRSTPPPYLMELVANGYMTGGPKRGGFHALHGLVLHMKESKSGVPFEAHMQNIASARHVLNVCGNGDSIDRKVVDYCGVGAAIISTRGLEDYRMPGWGQFTDRENIWFVDSVDDFYEATSMSRGERDRLVLGSRRIYDEHLSPQAMSTWWAKCAWEVAHAG